MNYVIRIKCGLMHAAMSTRLNFHQVGASLKNFTGMVCYIQKKNLTLIHYHICFATFIVICSGHGDLIGLWKAHADCYGGLLQIKVLHFQLKNQFLTSKTYSFSTQRIKLSV